MVTTILRPNADNIPNAWIATGCTSHHDCVDEDCTYDSACGDNNTVRATQTEHTLTEEYGMDNVPLEVGTITSIKVYALAQTGLDGGSMSCQYWNGSTWLPATPTPLTGLPGGDPPPEGWGSCAAWTGLSLSKANGDALQLRMIASAGAKLYSISVDVVYMLITYTPVGIQHDFIGLARAEISGILGVSKLVLDKIIGL